MVPSSVNGLNVAAFIVVGEGVKSTTPAGRVMSHRLTNASTLAACVLAVAIASHCNDPAGVGPTVITYDVTTTLDAFSFETGAPSPPDCPNATLYCTHVRAFSGAEL